MRACWSPICLLGLTLVLAGCAPLDRWFVWAISPSATGDPFSEDPPPILSAYAGDGRVELRWRIEPARLLREDSEVDIYRSTRRGGARQGEPFTRIAGVDGIVTTYVDGSVANATTYFYRAVAQYSDAADQTRTSNTVSATPGTVPCKPPNCPLRQVAAESSTMTRDRDRFEIVFTTSSLFHGRRSVVDGKARELGGQADGTFRANLSASGRRFSTGNWRMSLDLRYDPKRRKGSVTWLALAMFDGSTAGELCLRFTAGITVTRTGGRSRLQQEIAFETLGGTAAAARFRLKGEVHRSQTVTSDTPFAPPRRFIVRGTTTRTSGSAKPLPAACSKLRTG